MIRTAHHISNRSESIKTNFSGTIILL